MFQQSIQKKKNKLQNLIPGCPTRPGHPSNIQNQNLNIHSRSQKLNATSGCEQRVVANNEWLLNATSGC